MWRRKGSSEFIVRSKNSELLSPNYELRTMRIIFFGSDEFAKTHLEQLIASAHQVVACVAPPDKARGRGLKVAPSTVKVCAQQHKIPLFQPTDLREAQFIHQMKGFNCDLLVVIAYGYFLPAEVLQEQRSLSPPMERVSMNNMVCAVVDSAAASPKWEVRQIPKRGSAISSLP